MNLFLTVVHVMACLVLIVVVLLQRGKGAEMGAVFGGGGSNTVFGSRGAASFLSKLTTWCTVIFFVTSLSLAYIASRSQSSLFSGVSDEAASTTSQPAGAAQTPTSEAKTEGGFSEVPAAAPASDTTATPEAADSSAPAGESSAQAPTAAPAATETESAPQN